MWARRPAQAIPDRDRRTENSGPQRAQLSPKQLHGNMPGAPGLLKFHAVLEGCTGPITRQMQQLYLDRNLSQKDMSCICRTRKIQTGLVYFFGCFGLWVFLFVFFSYVGSLLSGGFSLKCRKAARNKFLGEKALQCLITAACWLQ